MKKSVLSFVLFASVIAANTQPRAIGGRLGYTAEVSYQHRLGSANMVQLDAGFPYLSSFQLTGTYNWLFPISSWKYAGSWNLYTGGGAGIGLGWYHSHLLGINTDYYYDNHRYYSRVYGVFGVAGIFGAEYNFRFPLQVFADYRPLIGIGVSRGGAWFHTRGFFNAAIGARYRFDFRK